MTLARTLLSSLLLIFCLSWAGCASAPLPRQDEAMQIVWNQAYMRSDSPPGIQWISGNDLNCFPDPKSNLFEGFWGAKWYGGPHTTECEAGLSWTDISLSQIAVYPPEPYFLFSSSSFAHELNHHRLARETGDGDGNHTDPSWGPGGIVEYANTALRAAGL